MKVPGAESSWVQKFHELSFMCLVYARQSVVSCLTI